MTVIACCTMITTPDHGAAYRAAITENPKNLGNQTNGIGTLSIGEHTKFWRPGRTLTIAIAQLGNGSFDVIKNVINTWAVHVNLKFKFIELSDNDELYEGDIRIDLLPLYNDLASSAVGTDALLIPSYKATMWLGSDHTRPGYEYVVLHEFGHALGRVHEHQHPDANIPWDREKTYQWFQRYGMSRELVDINVLPLERSAGFTYTPYDRYSVMHYAIPDECTLGDWHQPLNTELSARDIAFALRAYP
jgi:hypothetical protein